MTVIKNVYITPWNQLSELVLSEFELPTYLELTDKEKSDITRLYCFCNINSKISDLFTEIVNDVFKKVVKLEDFAKWCAENTDDLITGMLKDLHILNNKDKTEQ